MPSVLRPEFHGFHSLPSFVVVKIILGVNLITYAARRQAGMEQREAVDVVNNFGRDPIGEGNEERVSELTPSPELYLTVTRNTIRT